VRLPRHPVVGLAVAWARLRLGSARDVLDADLGDLPLLDATVRAAAAALDEDRRAVRGGR